MSIFDFITSSISGIGSAVSSVIDSINAPDNQKTEIKSKLESELNILKGRIIDSQDSLEKELTERLKIDMNSDSWLSKNIRPLSLAFNTFVLFSMIILNAFKVEFDSSIISMFSGITLLQYGFYFGSRGLEKISQINKGSGLISGAKNLFKGSEK